MPKKSQGDSIGYTADEWNSFVDAADDYRRRKEGGEGRGSIVDTYLPRGTIVDIKNTSGSAASRFDILGIDGIQITPTSNLAQFQDAPVLKGVTPATPTHMRKWALCLEPIANNEFGRALFSGITPAVVNIVDASHGFADIVDSSKRLTSNTSGAAEILYQESGTGDKHCVVRVGGSGAAMPIIGKLATSLANGSTGTVTIWEQTSSGGSYSPTANTVTAFNNTGQTLGTGVFLKVTYVQNAIDPIVEPAEWEDCTEDPPMVAGTTF